MRLNSLCASCFSFHSHFGYALMSIGNAFTTTRFPT